MIFKYFRLLKPYRTRQLPSWYPLGFTNWKIFVVKLMLSLLAVIWLGGVDSFFAMFHDVGDLILLCTSEKHG